jgi:hypothetical protein
MIPAHAAMLEQTATTLFSPGTVVEMRILNTPKDGTVAGYFDSGQPFVKAAAVWSGKAPAVYCTLNPVNPALIARSANRLKRRVKTTTADHDIVRRVWLPLDFDPVRPADISSTDAEHAAARERAAACTTWLTGRGWPQPICADSGNGAHLLYQIDLPNDDASRTLLKACLEALALYFADSVVSLDLSVFNAARIWKVYGTLACKGDNLPERPHRLARLLDVPSPLVCVTRTQLEDLAALLPAPPMAPSRRGIPQGAAFDLPQWIASHGVPVVAEGPWQQSGAKWVLNPCPWDSAHTNKSAFIVQFASGAIAAGCHHNGCQGNNWHALRDLYEPGWHARRFSSNGTTKQAGTSAAPPTAPAPGPEATDPRPEIIIRTEIPEITDRAAAALLSLPAAPVVYQRARRLCVIAPGGHPPPWLRRPPDLPVIVEASAAHLRELLSSAARWKKLDKRTDAYEPALPPVWVVETLQGRTCWDFPVLEGIVCSPTLRPDGSLLATPGYDVSTGLYLDFNGTRFPPLPPHPTRDDARAALASLREVFQDFLFAVRDDKAPRNPYQSAAKAAALTLVGRPAIQGNVPLFGVTATAAGSGKGKLVDAICLIGTGRCAPRMGQTLDENEELKRLLALALEGVSVCCLDNVTHPLGNQYLDMALTAHAITGRILGQTQTAEAPWNAVLFATGNNLSYRGDMTRRVVPIALDPKMEKPEERTNFTHPNLEAWIRQERPRLVTAALTILRAYFVAGCPPQGLTTYGSFEAWSDLIRQAMVWVGDADPCEGRQDLAAQTDEAYEQLATLLTAWKACYALNDKGTSKDMTINQVKQDIALYTAAKGTAEKDAVPNTWDELREALIPFDRRYDGKSLNTTRVGNALRAIEGRVIDHKRLKRHGEYRHNTLWRVEKV